MIEYSRGKATHSDQLERWLGSEQVAHISSQIKDFYWPIALHGVPGKVYAMPGGDFCGEINGGNFMSVNDRAEETLAKYKRERAATVARHRAGNDVVMREKLDRRYNAFSSMSALVTAASTSSKAQKLTFRKTGTASNAIGNCMDVWNYVGHPGAGNLAGTATFTATTSATTGALNYSNGATADSNHYVGGWVSASVASNSLLLYDRLGSAAKTMNSTTSEAISGAPSRYQSTVTTDVEYIGGNFVFPAISTVLAATAHNITAASTAVWTYTNQAGTTLKQLNNKGGTIQTLAGISAGTVNSIDLAAYAGWYIPLADGDTGVKAITAAQLSAAVATGGIQIVIGHPIAVFACPVAALVCQFDGVNTALNLTPILDDAALSFIELPKPATTATTYNGEIYVVSE